MFWNGSTAIDGLSGSASAGAWPAGEPVVACSALIAKLNPPRAHRLGNVLEGLLAQVIEGDLDLAADLPIGVIGDANAARLGDAFQPRRDVDAVAEDVVAVDDDVADIDADAELDPVSCGTSAFCAAMPRWTSTAQRTASTALANSTSMPSPVVLTMRPGARRSRDRPALFWPP